MGRGQAGAQRTNQQRHWSPALPRLPPTDSVSQPCVCSSWEIYGGSINGFYRQLLERAGQGLAVGGPSRRLTAKTLKYYGPTYIKSVLCAFSATSFLLTQERGIWPENSIVPGRRLARDQMPANSRSSPCRPGQEPLAGLAACMQGDSSEQQCQRNAGLLLPCPPDPLCPGSAHQVLLASGPGSSSFLCLESSLPTPSPKLFLPWPVPTYSFRTQLKYSFLRGIAPAF